MPSFEVVGEFRVTKRVEANDRKEAVEKFWQFVTADDYCLEDIDIKELESR